MDIVERIKKLCTSNGISPTQMLKRLGFSTGLMTQWNNGQNPSNEKLKAIADYFNVSVDYLLTGEETKKELPLTADEQWEQQLINDVKKLSDEKKRDVIDYVAFQIQKESGSK